MIYGTSTTTNAPNIEQVALSITSDEGIFTNTWTIKSKLSVGNVTAYEAFIDIIQNNSTVKMINFPYAGSFDRMTNDDVVNNEIVLDYLLITEDKKNIIDAMFKI